MLTERKTFFILKLHHYLHEVICKRYWLVSSPAVYLLVMPLVSLVFSTSLLLSSLFESVYPQPEGEARVWRTNQSIDWSMYPLLCPSDRQQKTKCLLSETFSFPVCPPHSCRIGPWDLSTQLSLVFQLHCFSEVTPVWVPYFCFLPKAVDLFCQFKVGLL